MIARKTEEFKSIKGEEHYLIEEEGKRKSPLVWLMIDEAHEFLPVEGKTAATDALLTILREGRQPGISLILASQQPGKIHSDVITQSDVVISHRLTAKIDVDACSRKVTVERKLDKGNREKIEAILPALLTVDTNLNEPRYSSLPSLIAGLRQEIKEYDLNALGLTEEEIEPKTRVVAFSLPKPRPKKPFTPDSNLPAAERMRLIMSGGITQKQGNLLQGDLDYIASSVVQFLIEQKLLT